MRKKTKINKDEYISSDFWAGFKTGFVFFLLVFLCIVLIDDYVTPEIQYNGGYVMSRVGNGTIIHIVYTTNATGDYIYTNGIIAHYDFDIQEEDT